MSKRGDSIICALRRGEDTAQFLDGREFDPRPWRNARRQVAVLLRDLERQRAEIEALRAVVGVGVEAEA